MQVKAGLDRAGSSLSINRSRNFGTKACYEIASPARVAALTAPNRSNRASSPFDPFIFHTRLC
jgi:hypothetical protein